MTKKYGDHVLDKYISTTGTVGAKYVCQEMTGLKYESASIKDARKVVAALRDPRLSKDIGRAYTSIAKSPVGIQARPPAAPAAKVHVPKGSGKKPTPPKNQAWPFPVAPAPVAAPVIHSIRIGNVVVEYDEGIKIHHYNNSYVRLVKA